MSLLLAVGLSIWAHHQQEVHVQMKEMHRLQQQRCEQALRWEKLSNEHQTLVARLPRLPAMIQVKGPKVRYVLEQMAHAHQLQEVQVTCEETTRRARCKVMAKGVSDAPIFAFMDQVSGVLPNVFGVTCGRIERYQSVTREALAGLAAGKPLTFLSSTLTIEWYYL